MSPPIKRPRRSWLNDVTGSRAGIDLAVAAHVDGKYLLDEAKWHQNERSEPGSYVRWSAGELGPQIRRRRYRASSRGEPADRVEWTAAGRGNESGEEKGRRIISYAASPRLPQMPAVQCCEVLYRARESLIHLSALQLSGPRARPSVGCVRDCHCVRYKLCTQASHQSNVCVSLIASDICIQVRHL